MDCPKFTDDYETILEWGKVAVKYDDGDDPSPHWRMEWTAYNKEGYGRFIFHALKYLPLQTQEKQARKAAALFVYLYSKGVDEDVAWECVQRYVE